MKTAQLTGAALDWAVDKSLNLKAARSSNARGLRRAQLATNGAGCMPTCRTIGYTARRCS